MKNKNSAIESNLFQKYIKYLKMYKYLKAILNTSALEIFENKNFPIN